MKKQILLLFFVWFIFLSKAQIGPLLMGATSQLGVNNSGTIVCYIGGDTSLSRVFNLPGNLYNVIYGPQSINLPQAPNGKLYGLSNAATLNGEGGLFEFDPRGNGSFFYKIFFDNATGDYPEGILLLASNGLMYGTTANGDSTYGGTLFSYVPGSYSITKLATLPNAAHQTGALIQASDSNIYGMTYSDGTNGGGTLFQYNITTGIFSVLYNLSAAAYPTGGLLELGTDTLYGLTEGGGIDSGGTLFRYVIGNGSFDILLNFPAGSFPNSSLIRASDGLLFGTTYGGGSYNFGTIFSYNIHTGIYTDRHSFAGGIEEGNPLGGLIQASNGLLYGTTYYDWQNVGTIYSYDIASSTFTSQLAFNSATGGRPQYGSLTEYLSRPIIFNQPNALTTCTGETANFNVAAGGYVMSTKWQVSTDGGISFNDVPLATSARYSLIASPSDSAHIFRVIFSNIYGADTSRAVLLTIYHSPAPDTITASICSGTAYLLDSNEYWSTGTYTVTFFGGSVKGCDSIVTLQLTVSPFINDWATLNGAVCFAAQDSATYQWLNCVTEQPIAGADSQTYIATANGSYQCIITRGSCSDTTNCVTYPCYPCGIVSVGAYQFTITPNPTSGSLTIEDNYPGALSVNIINLLGERLTEFSMTGAQQSFDITDLAAGIYEVQISDGAQTLKVMKVVKE